MGIQQDRSSDGSGQLSQSQSEAARRHDLRRRPTKVDLLDDLLPEHVHYRDDGCEVSPSCLACPLPVCRYEVKGGLAALQRAPRDAELLTAHKNGAEIEGLCREFGLSRRTVFRILASARASGRLTLR